ncbi:MAG TPA: ATP-binding protein [Spirochaetota bacterium]|nr:ATP-binding protein [Spirochaetota bacterium]HPQ52990.1 ATP-binding protein [Spirochaetota bacterium]
MNPRLLQYLIIISGIMVPSVYYVLFTFFPAIRKPAPAAVAVLLILLPALMLLYWYIHKKNGETLRDITKLNEQVKWINLILDNSGELIFVLNEFSQIISFNLAVSAVLGITKEDIIGKPFRAVMHNEYSSKLRLNELMLLKLKDVFSGNEAEMICSCKNIITNEIFTVTYKMIPIFSGNNLDSIIVIGRTMHIDSLTRNYLVRESSEYRLDNDLSQIILFCHRLTRNLEDRLPQNVSILLQIALEEILINSIEHGNLEIGYEKKTELKMRTENYWELLIRECNQEYLANRKIHVSYYLDNERVTYTIEDEGKGFNWKWYLENSSDISNDIVKNYHGMGLQIASNSFDISFNETGNIITLTKYFNDGRE